MDTRLIVMFMISGFLGVIIVVTGCIKVLGKNGVIDIKSVAFLIVGLLFVALPVLSTVNLEVGSLKVFLKTTNGQVKNLQNSLDSLVKVNNQLQTDLANLQNEINEYGQVMANSNLTPLRREEETRRINAQVEQISTRIKAQEVTLDSAIIKSVIVQRALRQYTLERGDLSP